MRGSIVKRETKKGTVVYDIVFDIGRDPLTGKRKQKRMRGFRTKKEAEAKLAEMVAQVERGTYLEPSKTTVGEYLQQWLEAHQVSVGAKTAATYAQIVRDHIVPYIGHIQLTKLKPIHIQQMYAAILEGERRDKKQGRISPTTVKHIHATLRKALNDAVRWQLIPSNPANAVTPPKQEPRECRAAEETEIRKVLGAFEGTLLEMPVYLALTTGARLGEILALRWEDVDLASGVLYIRRALGRNPLTGELEFKEVKTPKSRRAIEIGPTTVERLRKWRVRQQEMRLAAGPAWQDHGLLCCREDGSPLNPHTVSARFSIKVRKLGLALRFHDLRHTHATMLLKAGVNPKVVSERLGHSRVGMTLDTYSHVLPTMQREAAKAIEQLIRM